MVLYCCFESPQSTQRLTAVCVDSKQQYSTIDFYSLDFKGQRKGSD